jgi:hypothetical protein
MSLEFMNVLTKMKKPELIDLAQRFNLKYKIHNLSKLKRNELILELLVYEKEVKQIYNEDKTKADIRKERGLSEPKERKKAERKERPQEPLNKEINDLLKQRIDIAQSILKDENIPISEKQKGIKEMKAIDKKIMRLKEYLE